MIGATERDRLHFIQIDQKFITTIITGKGNSGYDNKVYCSQLQSLLPPPKDKNIDLNCKFIDGSMLEAHDTALNNLKGTIANDLCKNVYYQLLENNTWRS